MADPNIAIAILLGGLLVLILLRFPIVFAIAISTTACLLYLGFTPAALVQHTIRGMSAFNLMAVPFFITMGVLIAAGGVGDKLVGLAHATVGWMRGGLAQVNLISSTIFGGISGSPTADVASVGAVMFPIMMKNGYEPKFTGALTMSSAIQGLLIPPSHNMIIFATAAGGVSIGSLFLAAYIPEIIMTTMMITTVAIISRKRNYPKGDKFNIIFFLKELARSFWALAVVFIVVIGVAVGFFTATEAGALAVLYTLFITIYIYKGIKWRQVWGVLDQAVRTLSIVMILIGVSSAFGFCLTFLNVPRYAAEFITGISDNPIAIFIMINIMLLLMGTIMDMAPLILIATPILLPVAVDAGMSPITFGVMIVLNCGIGLITPPVGTTLFVAASVAKQPAESLVRANGPFYLVLLVTLLLITYIPAITLTIPRWFGF